MTPEAVLSTARTVGVTVEFRAWPNLYVKGRLSPELRAMLTGAKWAIIAHFLEPQLYQVSDALFRLEHRGKAGERTYANLTGHFINLRAAYELALIYTQRQEAAAA